METRTAMASGAGQFELVFMAFAERCGVTKDRSTMFLAQALG